jgi:hypothetical protein
MTDETVGISPITMREGYGGARDDKVFRADGWGIIAPVVKDQGLQHASKGPDPIII